MIQKDKLFLSITRWNSLAFFQLNILAWNRQNSSEGKCKAMEVDNSKKIFISAHWKLLLESRNNNLTLHAIKPESTTLSPGPQNIYYSDRMRTSTLLHQQLVNADINETQSWRLPPFSPVSRLPLQTADATCHPSAAGPVPQRHLRGSTSRLIWPSSILLLPARSTCTRTKLLVPSAGEWKERGR